jgi:hypothetical protein
VASDLQTNSTFGTCVIPPSPPPSPRKAPARSPGGDSSAAMAQFLPFRWSFFFGLTSLALLFLS